MYVNFMHAARFTVQSTKIVLIHFQTQKIIHDSIYFGDSNKRAMQSLVKDNFSWPTIRAQ